MTLTHRLPPTPYLPPSLPQYPLHPILIKSTDLRLSRFIDPTSLLLSTQCLSCWLRKGCWVDVWGCVVCILCAGFALLGGEEAWVVADCKGEVRVAEVGQREELAGGWQRVWVRKIARWLLVWDLLKRMKVGESLLAAHALTISYGGPPSEAQPPVWGESCFILLPPISLPTPHIGTCVGIGAGTRAHLDRFCIPPSTLTKIPSPQRV